MTHILTKEDRFKQRRKFWTKRRLRAAIAACSAMLAGDENEGDWPEDVTREDLACARERLLADLERAK